MVNVMGICLGSSMFASAKKLNNLIVFIDYNKWQATGKSDKF